MTGIRAASGLIALAWAWAALTTVRAGDRRSAGWCSLVAAAHLAVAAWPAASPMAAAAWVGYGVALPTGRLSGIGRRTLVAAATLGGVWWTTVLVTAGRVPSAGQLLGATLLVAAVTAAAAALRCGRATPGERRTLQWVAAGAVSVGTLGCSWWALDLLVGTSPGLRAWVPAVLVLVPAAQALASWTRTSARAEAALVESVVIAGMTGLVVAVYLVVVLGLGRAPEGAEHDILLSSIVAAVVVAVLSSPVRARLLELAGALVDRRGASAQDVVSGFGARMTRAVPMDELLLQLAESLRATVATGGAELWVGTDGVLTRTVSVPRRPQARMVLGERERTVVAGARLGGPSWTSVWLPGLLSSAGNGADLRVAPVSHLGELLGLVVVRRTPTDDVVTEDEEQLLVELARQLGLALHNMRLDSALQASLAELERRNAELQASRLRIVTASDESRRRIERNLHDGAQQHLVALAVKLGLAAQIADEEPAAVPGLLENLRADVQTTIRELRELAHGIYPPLLRDRGLAEALRTAANRSPLPCRIEVDLPGRFPEEAETAVYFCCLEALQNAGKHAGADAEITVSVGCDDGALWFSVRDDGLGFTPGSGPGHGFLNMADRLGSLGGGVTVTSAPGAGTTVRGTLPAHPLPVPPQQAGPGTPGPADAPLIRQS